MKKFITFLLLAFAMLLALPAQAGMWAMVEQAAYESAVQSGVMPVKRLAIAQQITPQLQAMNGVKEMPAALKQLKAKAPAKRRVAASATDLAGTYLWEHATASEQSEDPTAVESTPGSQKVTITATNDTELTIRGMFTNDLTGTYNAEQGVITVAGGQLAGTSSYGDYVLYGSFFNAGDDTSGAGWYYSDIYIVPGDNGVLTFAGNIWLIRVLSGGQYDRYSLTPYWLPGSTLTPTEPDAVVEVSNAIAASAEEYSVKARNYRDDADVIGSVFVAFDGNDVYMQGLCTYLPTAWVKGTLDGTTVTFAKGQYFGSYGGAYNMYLNTLMGEDVVFTYDAEAGILTAQNELFLTDNPQYYFDSYRGAVFTKVVEKAAMPANPSITGLSYNSSYGYYILFDVPNVDVDGDGLVASKLSYQLFVDVEKVVSPLVFTPATHSRLTKDMSVFPFGFTEEYDIYSNQIYLNTLYSDTWNKIGIKSIYTGGGETNETEIQWFTIKNYAIDDLTTEITAAETLVAGETYKTGQAALQTAIAAAKAVAESAESTTEQIQEALTALKAAEADFKALNTAYNSLAAEIEAATTLKESGTYGADALNQAIKNANKALNNAEATAETLNEALATLQAAEQAFKDVNGFCKATWDASKQSYTNAQGIESAVINEDLTLTLAKNDGTNAPAYYTQGSAIRVYDKNTFTITGAEGVKAITKIVITQPSSTYGTQLTANVGELTKSGSTLTWVGNATEVVFTNDRGEATSTVQTRFRTLTIDYMQKSEALVTVPETAEQQDWTIEGSYKSSWSNKDVQRATKVVIDGADIYVLGMDEDVTDTWIKGTIADGKATFPSQIIADMPEYGEKYYMLGSADGETIGDVVFTYDAEAQTLTQETQYIYINYLYKNKINEEYLAWWEQAKLYQGAPKVDVPVEAPEDLATDAWNFTSTLYDEAYAYKVQVGFDVDTVYIAGIIPNSDQLYIKAMKNAEGKYVVPALQFAGQGGSFWAPSKYYVAAIDAESNFVDLVFDYDAENEKFTTTQDIVINKGKSALSPAYTFTGGATIAKVKPVIIDVLPYSNSFTTMEDQDAFKIIDANGDNSTWSFEEGRVKYGYNSNNAADDWLVGPAIKLEAGKTYTFSIDAWRSSTSGTESFEVKMANAITAEALAVGTQVIEQQNIEPTEAQTYTNEVVTVAETGYYYFGIHATSIADQYGLFVTNFAVKESEVVESAHTWDFTKWSEETVTNLKAEAAKGLTEGLWSDGEKADGSAATAEISKDNCFWQVKSSATAGETLTANGVEIAELKGLLFKNNKARALAIAVNYGDCSSVNGEGFGPYHGTSYLWLGSSNIEYFIIKNVKPGSTIKMGVESHRTTDARGVQLLIGGTAIEGPAAPKTYEDQEWTVPASENATVDVVVKNTNGCHIYFIDAEIDNTITGITTVNAEVKAANGVYNLRGQKVENMVKGQLYIINGKKVVK